MRAISLAIPLVAAGLMFAQTAPSPQAAPPATSQKAPHRARNWRMRRLTARLNLTPDQQAKSRAIFQKTREDTRALAPQLRAERQAMMTAVKSDSPDQIQAISQQNAALNAKAHAIHTQGIADFYAILNPDQKAKFDRRLDHKFGPGRMHPRSPAADQSKG